jgi:hypothetical protein
MPGRHPLPRRAAARAGRPFWVEQWRTATRYSYLRSAALFESDLLVHSVAHGREKEFGLRSDSETEVDLHDGRGLKEANWKKEISSYQN